MINTLVEDILRRHMRRLLLVSHFSLITVVYVYYFFCNTPHRHPNYIILSASVLIRSDNGLIATKRSHRGLIFREEIFSTTPASRSQVKSVV